MNKISVAVPSYNYGTYLKDCLESISLQDFDNFEVLIADGGSTDETLSIIDRYVSKDERFKLVSTLDKGQADALQKAFTCSTGDILCFLNADDKFLCSDAFSSVVAAFNSYREIDIISFQGCYLNSDGTVQRPVRMRYHPLDNIAYMRLRTAVLQPATFWRRKVWQSIPFQTNSHYVFDSVFFYKAHLNFSWLEFSKPIAGHRLHGRNKSLNICFDRVKELVEFERLKFGRSHPRVVYLCLISSVIFLLDRLPLVGPYFKRFIYLIVNSASFITAYRLPSI